MMDRSVSSIHHKLICIQVNEFFNLFLLTRFVMPLPSRFRLRRLLANLSTAANYSIHFSLILLFAKLRLSTWQSQMAFARCCTPESVILLFERSSSRRKPTCFTFLLISLIYWSPMLRPERLTQPSYISVLKARPIADSFETFLAPAAGVLGAFGFINGCYCAEAAGPSERFNC